MPGEGGAGAAAEERQVFRQASRDRRRRECPEASGRQLDGEWDAVQAAADVGDRSDDVGPQIEPGPGLPGAGRGTASWRRSRPRRRRTAVATAETTATGPASRSPRRQPVARGSWPGWLSTGTGERCPRETGAGGDQVLAVVEDDQDVAISERASTVSISGSSGTSATASTDANLLTTRPGSASGARSTHQTPSA